MARFVVPVVVLVAMVGGYVVGQQPAPSQPQALPGTYPQPQPASPGPIPQPKPAHDGWLGVITVESPVGRYVPAELGRMLGTTNGTL